MNVWRMSDYRSLVWVRTTPFGPNRALSCTPSLGPGKRKSSNLQTHKTSIMSMRKLLFDVHLGTCNHFLGGPWWFHGKIDAILSFKAACLRCKLTTLSHAQTNPLWTTNSARVVVNSTLHFDCESHGAIQLLWLSQQVFIVKMQGTARSSHHGSWTKSSVSFTGGNHAVRFRVANMHPNHDEQPCPTPPHS